MATKFFEHFTYIGGAMKKMGGRGYELWDDDDGFFYDVLRYGDGSFQKFRVRSLVGLVPLFAVEVLDPAKIEHLEVFLTDVDWFVRNRPDLIGMACYHAERSGQKFEVLSIVDQQQLTRILQHVWNEEEFLSPGGIRSLSKCHDDHPFTFGPGTVRYEPAEADSKIKGGNSNWRGPVWFPTLVPADRSAREVRDRTRPGVQGGRAGNPRDAARPWRHGPEPGGQDDWPVHARAGRHAAHFRRDREVPAGSLLARLPPLPRILPW